jgi:hypothetical protein
MTIISLDQKLSRISIKDFEIENPVVFNFFDKLPAAERDEKFLRAVYIGVLALMEDRLSSFLAKTTNELGTELESLKMIFEMKQELFYKSSIKGSLAEEDIVEFLNAFISDRKLKDTVELTGNTAGKLPRNKTGDIVCRLDSQDNVRISIECKFDKSIKLGPIENKDIFTRKSDTVWSQLIEAQVNREGKTSIIVLDYSLIDNTVLSYIENVRFIPEIGFVAIIDTQKGDFSNLAIAYMLARDVAVNAKPVDLNKNLLAILINRTIKDLSEIIKIRGLVQNNIQNNKEILSQIEKSILLMEFNQRYLTKFLSEGTLTKEDLLAFYSGEEISTKYKMIEKEISDIG